MFRRLGYLWVVSTRDFLEMYEWWRSVSSWLQSNLSCVQWRHSFISKIVRFSFLFSNKMICAYINDLNKLICLNNYNGRLESVYCTINERPLHKSWNPWVCSQALLIKIWNIKFKKIQIYVQEFREWTLRRCLSQRNHNSW